MNILNKISDEFPNYSISKQCAPTFVEFHTGYSEEVMFVSAKEKMLTSQKPTSSNRPDISEFELTGSPLKLDLSLHNLLDDTLLLDATQHWRKEETIHCPINIESARKITNFYNRLMRDVPRDAAVPLWVVCNGTDSRRTLLLGSSSHKGRFNRNSVSYLGRIQIKNIDWKTLQEEYILLNDTANEEILYKVECKFRVAGLPAVVGAGHRSEDLLTSSHDGATSLHCHWSSPTFHVPFHTVKIKLEQDVMVGHTLSPCMGLWKSISALHNMNQIIVSVMAAEHATFNPSHYPIRVITSDKQLSSEELTSRLRSLIVDVEEYSYLATSPRGGCICITDDASTLTETLHHMERVGSSNDFTYRLWDILKECSTAEELISLLLRALKSISSGKIKPFINPCNKTYLAKLVTKLARGHSQTAAVLRNLKSNSVHALTLVVQLGLGKAVWEYTHLLTTLDTQFGVNNVLHADTRSSESVTEVINQTVHDMTLGAGAGDMTLNPFESRSAGELTLRLSLHDSLLQDEHVNELTVDNFASLKKLELNSGGRDMARGVTQQEQEQPLIVEEVDMSGWKTQLMRLAQLHVCLEHLRRAQTCLRLDISGLKAVCSGLRETYTQDKCGVRSVGQLVSEPLQSFTMPIHASLVDDHINNKSPSWYRVSISQERASRDLSLESNICTSTYLYSQHPVFPPSICANEEESDAELDTGTVTYHCTHHLHLSTPTPLASLSLTSCS